MRKGMFAICLLCAATLGAPQVEARPGGCLKYGVAGAVAGHYAGHHALKGAVAGCMAGIARRRLYEKQQREQQQMKEHAPAAEAPSHDTTGQEPDQK